MRLELTYCLSRMEDRPVSNVPGEENVTENTALRVGTTRRNLLTAAAAAAGSATLAAPALAQSLPAVTWRMPSSYGRALAGAYGQASLFIETVRQITDGRFQIEWSGPGEIVGPFAIVEAVQSGTVEIGYSSSFYFTGIDPTFALGSGLVFGMNGRGLDAWMTQGGGQELMDAFYARHNLKMLYVGHCAAQAAGWFRREINSLEDLQGLRMRISGLAGRVFSRVGGAAQQIPIGDAYTALERGVLDAVKFTSPADDQALGFVRVAPYYYFPGWTDGATGVHMFVNPQAFEALPPLYRHALEIAAKAAAYWLPTHYDSQNPIGLRALVAQGAQVRQLPRDVLSALRGATDEMYAELSAADPVFAEIYTHQRQYSDSFYEYWRIGEVNYDVMMVR